MSYRRLGYLGAELVSPGYNDGKQAFVTEGFLRMSGPSGATC